MRVRLAVPMVFLLSLVLVLGWAVTVQGQQTEVDQNPPEAQESNPMPIDSTLPLSRTASHATFLPLVGADIAPVYQDDFSNPDSGWYVGTINAVQWKYRVGGYEIKVSSRGWWGAEDAPWSGRRNYAVAADMYSLPGNTAYYGLIFGFRDWDHFYLLLVNPADRQYAILKRTPGWVWLVPWTNSTSIRQGSLTNRLRVERNGNDITAFINGRLLRTISDGTFVGVTNVGVYTAPAAGAPTTARFDNFKVWALGASLEDSGEMPSFDALEVSPGMSGPDAPQP